MPFNLFTNDGSAAWTISRSCQQTASLAGARPAGAGQQQEDGHLGKGCRRSQAALEDRDVMPLVFQEDRETGVAPKLLLGACTILRSQAFCDSMTLEA